MNKNLVTDEIMLRFATDMDAKDVFLWRNSPETRKYSFNSQAIKWEDHWQWFTNTLQQKDRFILIGEIQQEAIGVLRYDIHEEEAEVGIYLLPKLHGKGLGSHLLQVGNK